MMRAYKPLFAVALMSALLAVGLLYGQTRSSINGIGAGILLAVAILGAATFR